MVKIPKCAGCAEPCPEGMTLPGGGVVCSDCDDFATGYDKGLGDHIDERERLQRKIADLEQRLSDQADAHESAIERERQVAFENGRIEGARDSRSTERKALERAEQIERLQGLLTEEQGKVADLEGRLATAQETHDDHLRDYGARIASLESELQRTALAAAEAEETVEVLRQDLRQARDTVVQQQSEADQYGRALAEAGQVAGQLRAELDQAKRAAASLPALVHPPDPVRTVRRWLSRVPWTPSEYDLEALERALGGE